MAIWRLIYAFTSVPLLDAAVDQQITEWCLPENRKLYYSKLECPVRRKYIVLPKDSPECGPECEEKLQLLQDMGGCRFLNRICEDHSFDFVGKGRCLAEEADGRLVPAPYRKGSVETTDTCCRLECNLMSICKGYSFHVEKETLNWHGGQEIAGTCYLMTPDLSRGAVSPGTEIIKDLANENATEAEIVQAVQEEAPRRLWSKDSVRRDEQFHKQLKEMYRRCSSQTFDVGSITQWDPYQPLVLVSSDKRRQTSCWKKGRPRIVQETLQSNMWSSIICSVEVVLLALATTTGLFYQYSLATKRRGRKGLAFVLKHMLCPCLGNNSNRARKISDDFSSESESTGSSRSSSSSDVL